MHTKKTQDMLEEKILIRIYIYVSINKKNTYMI